MYCIAKCTVVHLKNVFCFLLCVYVKRRFLSAGTSNSHPLFCCLVFLGNVLQCQKCLGETFHHTHRQRWSPGHKARGQGQGHKKIRGQGQGQGQPFRGQTLSRPRTGMLEAKAKDQGHKRKCSPKKKRKKSLHKNFSGDLHEKTFFKKFFKRSTKF